MPAFNAGSMEYSPPPQLKNKMSEKIVSQTSSPKRGALKIFLGFAAGVGKTYAMLDEALRRQSRGQDVVIGFIEAHGRAATANHMTDIEAVPRKVIDFRGAKNEELDTQAILARKPYVVL